MEEIAPGVRHWKSVHPNLGIEVSAYWLPELRLLLDPIGVPDDAYEFGEPLVGGEVTAYQVGGLSPDEDKAAVKRGLGKLAETLEFDVLLLAHGNPIPSGGREALRRFSE